MREIKFRTWDGEQMISPDYIGRDGKARWSENSIPQYTDKVMQFTGLRDKNGKQIWEGDIVRSPGGPIQGIVVWQAPSFVMKDKLKSGYSKRWTEFFVAPGHKQLQEVIGNIYENPELVSAA